MKERRSRLGRRLAPYLMISPGGAWLLLLFLIPMFFMASLSLQSGNFFTGGFRFTWHFANFSQAFTQYHTQFVRSLIYGSVATAATVVVSYPLAYWIAFHGGRHKNTFLFMLLLPFFVSFVIRTLAWQWILSDNGIVLGTLRHWHLISRNFHVLSSWGRCGTGT